MTSLMAAPLARPPSIRALAAGACALAAGAWLATAVVGCGGAPATPPPPTTPRTLTAMPQTVWVQPGATGALAFEVRGPTGAPLPGANVAFAILDNPDTPGVEAKGATLASASATTDVQGLCGTRVTAGLATAFRVRATSAAATADVAVVVAAGVVGSVDVAPFFVTPASGSATPTGARGAALAATIQILFFDNSACRGLSLRTPPQPARAALSVSVGSTARYDFVSTAVSHAVLGQALDASGLVLSAGCTDLPGPSLVAGGDVQLALPLVDLAPDPTGTYAATTVLSVSPPLAAAATLAATWRDLTDCALDPAQLWLDCTIDALVPASAANPLDCVPALAPGAEGPIGDALEALRGTFVTGPDGTPTVCRGAKDAQNGESIDAVAQGLFGSPLPTAIVHLMAAADDAAHLFDALRISSMLDIAAGATESDVSITHTLTAVTFTLASASTDVVLEPLGLPVLTATVPGTIEDSTLVVPWHGFTVRLGRAARVAFGALSLNPRGLPSDGAGVATALAGLAHGDDVQRVGCLALDDALCPRINQMSGCLMAACSAGFEAMGARLDGAFDAADGTGVDLALAGQAPLLDTHGDGFADRLGDLQVPAQVGTWAVDLTPRTGLRAVTGTWEAIRGGNQLERLASQKIVTRAAKISTVSPTSTSPTTGV